MYLPDELKQQLLSATSQQQALALIVEHCFREDQQEAACDFLEENTNLFPEGI